MRLNQYLAKSGLAARRKTKEIIISGRVTINERITTNPYHQVKKGDTVRIFGKKIELAKNIYILIHKPKGVTTTCSDKFAKINILDILPKKITRYQNRLYPVGRLDKDSTGLVIVTNDGDFCHKMTHPKFEVEKEYILKLSKQLSKVDQQRAKAGIIDNGELLSVKKIKILKDKKNLHFNLGVTITEGKKRHLRRLFNKLGYKVEELKRVRIGNIKLQRLKEGKFIFINPQNT